MSILNSYVDWHVYSHYINSMDSKGEVILTIMASLAQQESQSLSQNVKLGLQYRYQQGEIQANCNRFLRLTKDGNKHPVIVPGEAEIVKRIYREYLEGASMLKITRGLMAEGIRNGAGSERWHSSNINQILRNEKYIGDALLQKTYTVDFLITLQNNIATVLSKGNDKTLADIDNRLEELQTQLLKLANSKASYEDVADEIYRLCEQKQKAQVENVGRDEQRKRIADMSAFLQEQPTAITEYDEQLVRWLIEKVTVYEGRFTTEFKSNMTVDVET